MNPGSLFLLLLIWPLAWGYALDALFYLASMLESVGDK